MNRLLLSFLGGTNKRSHREAHHLASASSPGTGSELRARFIAFFELLLRAGYCSDLGGHTLHHLCHHSERHRLSQPIGHTQLEARSFVEHNPTVIVKLAGAYRSLFRTRPKRCSATCCTFCVTIVCWTLFSRPLASARLRPSVSGCNPPGSHRATSRTI